MSQRNRGKESLHEHVSSATNIHDLLPILECIPLNIVQNMIDKHIDEMDANETKHCEYHSTSIENILPECIIQYILSFNHLNHAKSVNTNWKQYSQKNEEILIKQQLQTMMQDEFHTTSNITWLIHPNRKKLYEWEKELGWKVPINTFDIDTALKICKPGDRILFHNGQYTHSQRKKPVRITSDLHLIGIGDNIVFKDQFVGGEYSQRSFIEINENDYYYRRLRNKKDTVYLENIKFDCRNTCSFNDMYEEEIKLGHIFVGRMKELVMKNCRIEGANMGNGIVTMSDSWLKLEYCKFIGYNGNVGYERPAAISIAETGFNASIQRCVFRDCGYKSVTKWSLQDTGIYYVNGWNHNRKKSVKLTCFENVFIESKIGDYYGLSVYDFVNMIEQWMQEDSGLTKRQARNKLHTKFDVKKKVIKSDGRFGAALNIVRKNALCC